MNHVAQLRYASWVESSPS